MEKHFDFYNKDDLIISSLVESFKNKEIPYKIRKINLLMEANLPIPETSYFKKDEIFELKKEVIEKTKNNNNQHFVIRLACIPDKLSMPVFHIGIDNLDGVLSQIRLLCQQDDSISHLILREAIGVGDEKEKIVGRLTFESSKMLPVEQVLEIYKGSETTSILNNVNPGDPNFYSFTKNAGNFMKPSRQIRETESLSSDEVKELYCELDLYKNQMELVKKVFSEANRKKEEEISLGLEFSFYKGKIFFHDMD